MSYLTRDKSWFQKVAEGLVPGYSSIEKFGANNDVDTGAAEDIWDYGGTYTFSTSVDIAEIASSNVGDTQQIIIFGLNAAWEEISQTITLTGQTPVTLTTPLIRVYRMINVDTTDLSGTVYLATTAATWAVGVPSPANTVRAQILGANNQTLMAIYTIPAGKTGYFWSGYVATTKSAGNYTTFAWRARTFGSVFSVKSIISCIDTGSSTWDYMYKIPLALPEKTDVVISVQEAEANNTGVSGGFTVLLKDN